MSFPTLRPRRASSTLVVATLLLALSSGLGVAFLPPPATATRGSAAVPALRAAGGGGIGHLRAEPAAPAVEGRAETIRGAAQAPGPCTASALPTDQPATHPSARTLAREWCRAASVPSGHRPAPELCRPPPSSV